MKDVELKRNSTLTKSQSEWCFPHYLASLKLSHKNICWKDSTEWYTLFTYHNSIFKIPTSFHKNFRQFSNLNTTERFEHEYKHQMWLWFCKVSCQKLSIHSIRIKKPQFLYQNFCHYHTFESNAWKCIIYVYAFCHLLDMGVSGFFCFILNLISSFDANSVE